MNAGRSTEARINRMRRSQGRRGAMDRLEGRESSGYISILQLEPTTTLSTIRPGSATRGVNRRVAGLGKGRIRTADG